MHYYTRLKLFPKPTIEHVIAILKTFSATNIIKSQLPKKAVQDFQVMTHTHVAVCISCYFPLHILGPACFITRKSLQHARRLHFLFCFLQQHCYLALALLFELVKVFKAQIKHPNSPKTSLISYAFTLKIQKARTAVYIFVL